jgi:hypothetical protein
MGKSLEELVGGIMQEAPSSSHKPPSKLVKCSRCGKKIPVSGYDEEVMCKECTATVEQQNNDVVTSDFYPFQRHNTKEKIKVRPIIPAVPYKKHYGKSVADKTGD